MLVEKQEIYSYRPLSSPATLGNAGIDTCYETKIRSAVYRELIAGLKLLNRYKLAEGTWKANAPGLRRFL